MKLGQEDDKDYQFIQDGLVATIDKRPGVKETLALLLPDTEERAGERPEPLLLRF